MTLISIVTPSFNQARFLEATIRSVLEQDHPDIEYIIVDGGSTDGSVDIIRRYSDRLAAWISERDEGQTDAINKGFARARGGIFAWINSDDTYEPGAFREVAEYFSAHPNTGLVYGDANYIDETGLITGRFPAARTDYARLRRGFAHIPQQAAFFRADLWRRVGPLDPSFSFAMDYDLWVRIAACAPLEHIPRVWANFRIHGEAKTSMSDEGFWREILRVHYRDGGSWVSMLHARYLVRRVTGPLWPWRMWLHKLWQRRA